MEFAFNSRVFLLSAEQVQATTRKSEPISEKCGKDTNAGATKQTPAILTVDWKVNSSDISFTLLACDIRAWSKSLTQHWTNALFQLERNVSLEWVHFGAQPVLVCECSILLRSATKCIKHVEN